VAIQAKNRKEKRMVNIEELEIAESELYHAGYICDEEYNEIIDCLSEDEDEMVLRQIAATIIKLEKRVRSSRNAFEDEDPWEAARDIIEERLAIEGPAFFL
jgi:hypothetical protein